LFVKHWWLEKANGNFASCTATKIKNAKDAINLRLTTLMRYILKMAEF